MTDDERTALIAQEYTDLLLEYNILGDRLNEVEEGAPQPAMLPQLERLMFASTLRLLDNRRRAGAEMGVIHWTREKRHWGNRVKDQQYYAEVPDEVVP